jgi:hypothetical protein
LVGDVLMVQVVSINMTPMKVIANIAGRPHMAGAALIRRRRYTDMDREIAADGVAVVRWEGAAHIRRQVHTKGRSVLA